MSERRPNEKPRSAGARPTQPRRRSPAPARRSSSVRRPDGQVLGLPRSLAVLVGGLLVIVVFVAGAIALLGSGAGTAASPSGRGGSSVSPSEWTVRATGGTWTNINAERLAKMLEAKDFTLLNVKTPYIGEIAGTDLYIPYNQLAARRSELPPDTKAKLVVYCRSGAESAVAAQTLISLGYSNVYNLDGGMNGWTQSGRGLVNLNRS